MTHQEIAAYAGVVIGIIGLVAAFVAQSKARSANELASTANALAATANNLNIDFFKRQGVIDLHMAWRAVNEIDPNKLIGPDVNLAANALDLTASLWNHDVMEKEILYQSYWESYRLLFETLKKCDKVVPGYTRKCNEFLSPAVELAYEGLKAHHLSKISTSKVKS